MSTPPNMQPLPVPARTKRMHRLWHAEDAFPDLKMRDRFRSLVLAALTESVEDAAWDAAILRAKSSLRAQQKAEQAEVAGKL